VSFPFVKGHGTRNDFIVLPDLDGSVHGDLDAALVADLCDRRGGIGADGVLRVVRSTGDTGASWFMDYRNADGSVSEMCGNGVRVFARYLAREGLVDGRGTVAIDTRDGVKQVTFCDDGEVSVDMGSAVLGDSVKVVVDGRALDALAVDVGNPHAVAFVESLDEPGDLRTAPDFSPDDFPTGVNIEFAVLRGPSAIAMRVYERGVGETQSCGTGACAAVFAAAVRQAVLPPTTYRVEVPGGVLSVTYDSAQRLHLKGPAVLVADGVWNS
jgi:diaminopimelate epimerase